MKTARLTALLIGLGISPVQSSEHFAPEFLAAAPRVQLYMAYAQFKMAHHQRAREMWLHIGGSGRAEAAFNLAILYEQGLGVEKDPQQALDYYLQAANAGSRAAAFQLGLIYLNHPTRADASAAEHWLTLAALDGDEEAAELLKSMRVSISAASNDPMIRVRTLLANGDADEALALLKTLTQRSAPDYRAMTRMAWLYETGIGVDRDIDQAGRLFARAAEAGIAEAQYALSVMLHTGVGRPQNRPAAQRWLQRAAAQNYPPALQKLTESKQQ